ncbi:MAG: glutamate---cysteine ligase / carboxylate-amine ligase [Solirubrobacteraceae bacterium]|jgi:hypothetical protein|nr:glutamate---cysteine ligase / carboxylate-amine ligase [Solirubrobacteraceae bacterium]
MTLRLAEDTLFSDRFGTGAPFRVGVEEELFLLDHHAHALSPCTDELLGALRRPLAAGGVLGELCDGVIELATPPCASADEVIAALRALRATVLATGRARLLGAGLHPATPFGDVHHRDGRHYDAVGHDTRGTLRQAIFCGVHVHVAMPDAETAITAFNGMRKWLPLLQALAANSPFWHGQDSGLASARTVRIHDVPRSGTLRAFRDWPDYRDTMRELVRLAETVCWATLANGMSLAKRTWRGGTSRRRPAIVDGFRGGGSRNTALSSRPRLPPRGLRRYHGSPLTGWVPPMTTSSPVPPGSPQAARPRTPRTLISHPRDRTRSGPQPSTASRAAFARSRHTSAPIAALRAIASRRCAAASSGRPRSAAS